MNVIKKLKMIMVMICLMLSSITMIQPIKGAELKGSTNAEKLFNFFYEKGYTPQAAAAIVGNVMWESSGGYGSFDFPLHAVEAGSGEGIGMCQWSYSRKYDFIRYCEKKGIPWNKSTLKIQAEFLNKELESGDHWLFPSYIYSSYVAQYKMTYSQFKNQTNVTKAVGGFCYNFERPSEYYAHFAERVTYANRVLNTYYKKLSAPTKVNMDVNGNDVALTWKKGTSSTKTRIEVYDVNYKKVFTHTTKNEAYKVKDLKAGIYYIRIGAMSPRDELKFSKYEMISIGTSSQQALVMATNLTSKAIDYDTLEVKWTAAKNAKEYIVYRSVDGGSYQKYKTLTTTSFKMNDAQTGLKYAFKVKANVETKFGVLASPMSKAVTGRTKLTDKANLTIERLSNTKFNLSWDKVDGATSYHVYMKDSKGSYQKVKELDACVREYTTSVLTPETYSFVVKASRYEGAKHVYSAQSNTVRGKSVFVKTNVTLTQETSSSIEVKWQKVDGVPYYSVYRKVGTNGIYQKINSSDTTRFVDKGLTENKTYTYTVKGYRMVNGREYYSPESDVKKLSL